jgi:hypothetical protein
MLQTSLCKPLSMNIPQCGMRVIARVPEGRYDLMGGRALRDM